jgi:L-arabinose isomerase
MSTATRTPSWFLKQLTATIDTIATAQVFMGEYAAQKWVVSPDNRNDLECALSEAAFMTGLERNADVVRLASYAPLLAHVDAWQWRPNLIWADNLRVFGTPSYYVQQLYSRHRGDVVLPVSVEGAELPASAAGRIGVGTYQTAAEFQDVRVTRGGETLLAWNFSANGSQRTGGRWVVEGEVLQQMDPRGNAWAWAGDPSWADTTLTLKARKLDGREGFLVGCETRGARESSGTLAARKHAARRGGGGGRTALAHVPEDRDGSLVRHQDRAEGLHGFATSMTGSPRSGGAPPRLQRLYASAVRDDATGDVILKVVNPFGEPADARSISRGQVWTATTAGRPGPADGELARCAPESRSRRRKKRTRAVPSATLSGRIPSPCCGRRHGPIPEPLGRKTMIESERNEAWFVTGSQELYGPEVLKRVASNSREIAANLDASRSIPSAVVFKSVLKSPAEVFALCQEANQSPRCIGLITWCHTFSPSKMWINGLKILRKPLLHLHTQHNRDLPWPSIDMDFMNLNQAAHGDREHAFILSRLRMDRKVVTGFWREPGVHDRIGAWYRAAAAWHDWQGAKFARFGDNMREVAVTEGDKVSAEARFGYSVNGYGVGDLVECISAATARIDPDRGLRGQLPLAPNVRKNGSKVTRARSGADRGRVRVLERAGSRASPRRRDLHDRPSCGPFGPAPHGPGMVGQRDWKTCALVRDEGHGRRAQGRDLVHEDYTYHLHPKGRKVLGAHMLEICPSIARGKPSLEVHPLGIGGKADPARLVFDTPPGPAVNASIMDMGNRFRLLVNEVTVVAPEKPLPRLPVARAVWAPKPSLEDAATAWLYAGGAHHTGFSQVTTGCFEDFAAMAASSSA